MPRGSKRKREEEDEPDPPPRQSSRRRKQKSFGEEFEEQFSPPKGSSKPTPQQPKATKAKPGPSTEDPDPNPEDPEPELDETVTWASKEKYWKQLLPRNHRKRLYFSRQHLWYFSKRFIVSIFVG